MNNDANIDLVGSFLQAEGQFKIGSITHNYDSKGGVLFSGYRTTGNPHFPDHKSVKISMDKNQVELVNECKTILEVYECYREMEHYREGGCTDGGK